jgi:hypothetical protein
MATMAAKDHHQGRPMKYLLATALLLSMPAHATDDWSANLRMDAQAMHDDIARNHPGTVDPLNPGFAKKNDQGLAVALQRAKTTKDYAGYLFAMRAYAAGFDDGHLSFYPPDPAKEPKLNLQWPGFLTTFNTKDEQRVVTRAGDAPVPNGALLVSCDGIDAATLAARNVGPFYGRWNLHSTRAWRGVRLFIDAGNPWVPRPKRCTFNVDGSPRDVELAWRDFPDADRNLHIPAASHRTAEPIGMRTLPDGTVWIALSDFDGDLDKPAAKALTPLIADIAAKRATILAAPRVVLDLRGNNGGNSTWAIRIAEAMWGKDAVEKVNVESTAVDWRASAGVVERLQEIKTMYETHPGTPSNDIGWITSVLHGVNAAMAAHKPYFRETYDQRPPTPKPPATHARIYMVTDYGCASACLDGADTFTALGAIHVGEETSADTLYMDVRQVKLPSGYGALSVAMKVYRGRPRGNNVPLKPRYPYPGDVADTPSLERWITELP